jgi:hypothetical protein
MTDLDYFDTEDSSVNRVNDPVLANPDTPEMFSALQFFTA